MRKLLEFRCRECGEIFERVGNPRRPHLYCPECKHRHALDNARKCNRKVQVKRYRAPSHSVTKAPITVIEHNEEDGFYPGAKFSCKDMVEMVKNGWVEGMKVEKVGKKGVNIYLVKGRKMVEVAA